MTNLFIESPVYRTVCVVVEIDKRYNASQHRFNIYQCSLRQSLLSEKITCYRNLRDKILNYAVLYVQYNGDKQPTE